MASIHWLSWMFHTALADRQKSFPASETTRCKRQSLYKAGSE